MRLKQRLHFCFPVSYLVLAQVKCAQFSAGGELRRDGADSVVVGMQVTQLDTAANLAGEGEEA